MGSGQTTPNRRCSATAARPQVVPAEATWPFVMTMQPVVGPSPVANAIRAAVVYNLRTSFIQMVTPK